MLRTPLALDLSQLSVTFWIFAIRPEIGNGRVVAGATPPWF